MRKTNDFEIFVLTRGEDNDELTRRLDSVVQTGLSIVATVPPGPNRGDQGYLILQRTTMIDEDWFPEGQ